MNFKNYVKISLSNFSTAWKHLLYRIVVWLVVLALIAPFYSLIKEVVLANWNYDLFKEFALAGVFYGNNVTLTFAKIMELLLSVITGLFAEHLAATIYFLFILFILKPFLMNIGRYVVSETTYGYMSSHSRHGFCSSLVRTLGKSSAYSILRVLFCLPFNAIVAGAFYGLLLIKTTGFSMFMPLAFLAIAVIVLTIKKLLIMSWAPAMVVSGENVAKSYNLGIKATFRGFGRSLAFSFAITFVSVALSLGLGVFSLVVIVPANEIISSTYETMHYFSCQGMRYYTDGETVNVSKKLEEQDKIYKLKYLL